MNCTVPLDRILNELGHWALRLRQAGDIRAADMLREVTTRIIRLADESEPPRDNTDDTN